MLTIGRTMTQNLRPEIPHVQTEYLPPAHRAIPPCRGPDPALAATSMARTASAGARGSCPRHETRCGSRTRRSGRSASRRTANFPPYSIAPIPSAWCTNACVDGATSLRRRESTLGRSSPSRRTDTDRSPPMIAVPRMNRRSDPFQPLQRNAAVGIDVRQDLARRMRAGQSRGDDEPFAGSSITEPRHGPATLPVPSVLALLTTMIWSEGGVWASKRKKTGRQQSGFVIGADDRGDRQARRIPSAGSLSCRHFTHPP